MAKHPYHEILGLLTQAGGDTIGDFLRQTAALLINGLGQRQDVLNLLFIELVEFNGKHLSMVYAEALPELARLGQIFAQKRGRLRQVPMPILVRSFAGLFFSYFITEQVLPEEARALMGEHALETFVDIYLHGILAEPEELPHA
jgi:AcrR family transcriptional regulator